MPTAGSDFDITLNSQGYNLARDPETGTPQWAEGRADVVSPPAVDAGGATLLDTDPLDKFVIAHYASLDDGFGASIYDRRQPNRYGASNGAFMLDRQRVGPNNKLYHVGFGIANPGAEESGTPHTVSNATITATLSVANSYEGEYHWAFTTSAGDGIAYWTLSNPTVLRSVALTFRGMGRMSAVATGEAGRLFIWDDVTGYTYSSAVSAATYAAMTVTATISATAATVRVGIADNGTLIDTETFRVDALGIASAGTDTPVGFAVLGTNLYTAAGRFVYQWDETNDKFDIVYVLAANATDIETFGTNVYVATGSGNLYVYGSTTSWTASNRGGVLDEADFFQRSMDRDGNAVMWRGLKPNTVSVSDNPANSGTAWTDTTVGEADADLTGVYSWNRTVLAGKEDGLYALAGKYYQNVTAEKEVAPNTDNFAKGQEFRGQLYLSGAQGTMWRFSLGLLEGPLDGFRMEGYEYGPGGKIGALATDGTNLLIGTQRKNTASTAWVMQSRNGESIHTLYDFAAPDTTQWAVGTMDTHAEEIQSITAMFTFSNYVYVAGTTTNGVTRVELVRFPAPTTSETPYRDTAPDPQSKFYLRLPRTDGGFPHDTKSFTDVRIGSRNLTATNRVLNLYYRVDDGAWTSLSAANTSPSQTLTFTNVNGKELELIVEGASTTGATSPIEFLPITITGTLRPSRKRTYVLLLRCENGPNDQVAMTQYANLRTAEASGNPVTLAYVQDFVEGGTVTSVTVHVKTVSLEQLEPNPFDSSYSRVYRVALVED